MSYKKRINPWISNNFMDSCAFNPAYSPEDSAAKEIFDISRENEQLGILIAHSSQKEIDHPITPAWVKEEAKELIATLELPLTQDELDVRRKILYVLTGNGNPANYEADAHHVFLAQRYGSVFITTDRRILKKAVDLKRVCSVEILLPSTFLALLRINEVPSA